MYNTLSKIFTFQKASPFWKKEKRKIFEELEFRRTKLLRWHNYGAKTGHGGSRAPLFLLSASGSTGSNFRIHNRGCRLRKSFESYFVKSSNARRTHVRDRFSRHVFQSSARSAVKVSIPPFSSLSRVRVRMCVCVRGEEEYFQRTKGWNNSTHDR